MTAPGIADRRRNRGALAYHSGRAAEQQVAQEYARRGFVLAQERWRGKAGEIDLILTDGAGLIFVEVKQARNFERAAVSLSERQIRRLYAASQEYLGCQPHGLLTDVRFDVALVNGLGETRIIENAFA